MHEIKYDEYVESEKKREKQQTVYNAQKRKYRNSISLVFRVCTAVRQPKNKNVSIAVFSIFLSVPLLVELMFHGSGINYIDGKDKMFH